MDSEVTRVCIWPWTNHPTLLWALVSLLVKVGVHSCLMELTEHRMTLALCPAWSLSSVNDCHHYNGCFHHLDNYNKTTEVFTLEKWEQLPTFGFPSLHLATLLKTSHLFQIGEKYPVLRCPFPLSHSCCVILIPPTVVERSITVQPFCRVISF